MSQETNHATATHPLVLADQAAQGCSTEPPGTAVMACPHAHRYAIETVVLDADDRPVFGIAVTLFQADGQELRRLTNSKGFVRFSGLAQGSYRLTLSELDKGCWEMIETTVLPDRHETGFAPWSVAVPSAPDGAFEHEVADGECISSLAARFGFAPDLIWELSDNSALYKLGRKENILYSAEGRDNQDGSPDYIGIPAKTLRTENVSTGHHYTLRHIAFAVHLRLQIINASGEVRTDVPYLLRITDIDGTIHAASGKTDAEGKLAVPVPPQATEGLLTVGTGAEARTLPILIGHLEPVNTLEGVRARLTNLGYSCEAEPGEREARSRRALSRFQESEGLRSTGALDQVTQSALEAAHLN